MLPVELWSNRWEPSYIAARMPEVWIRTTADPLRRTMIVSMEITDQELHDLSRHLYQSFFGKLMQQLLEELASRFAREVAEELHKIVMQNVDAGTLAGDIEQMVQNLLEQKINQQP